LSTRQPAIHVTVGNGVDAKPIFDTGSDFLVILSDQLRSSGKVVPLSATIMLANGGQFEEKVTFGGVDGTGERIAPCSHINQILVGPYRYENSQVCFGDPNVFGAN